MTLLVNEPSTEPGTHALVIGVGAYPCLLGLAAWYPWMPDGRIVRGWLALRGQRGADDVREARTQFLAAARGGLPVYSLGVKMLVDGLSMFAHDDRAGDAERAEVRAALTAVRGYAVRVDSRSPFTTLWLQP